MERLDALISDSRDLGSVYARVRSSWPDGEDRALEETSLRNLRVMESNGRSHEHALAMFIKLWNKATAQTFSQTVLSAPTPIDAIEHIDELKDDDFSPFFGSQFGPPYRCQQAETTQGSARQPRYSVSLL
jgi:hypothetical protein